MFSCQLNKHVQQKKKWIQGNTKSHVNKKLCSAIMKKSRLKIMPNKTKSRNDIINYKKQRNLVVKLNNISKFEYFNIYDPNKQAKHFWVNCKPYF